MRRPAAGRPCLGPASQEGQLQHCPPWGVLDEAQERLHAVLQLVRRHIFMWCAGCCRQCALEQRQACRGILLADSVSSPPTADLLALLAIHTLEGLCKQPCTLCLTFGLTDKQSARLVALDAPQVQQVLGVFLHHGHHASVDASSPGPSPDIAAARGAADEGHRVLRRLDGRRVVPCQARPAECSFATPSPAKSVWDDEALTIGRFLPAD
mmetsp:Transcript_90958/g.211638  ORF Transcript_90958/g.211638 Transcript_90958/m.211638 type:complete len:210 (-) Transcript_90958:366-995(-)